MDSLTPLHQSVLSQPHTRVAARRALEEPRDSLGAALECGPPGILSRLALAQACAAPVSREAAPPPGISLDVLRPIAREAMTSRGLATEFSPEALAEVRELAPARLEGPGVEDLRHLQWVSIDNESTRDIDQLAWCQDLGGGRKRLLVAIADVAEVVRPGTALDREIQKNTVTVYNPGCVQPMMPEQLSTDWTSLGPDVDRRAMVTELVVGADGEVESTRLFEAAVRNHCKTDYKAVSGWLEGTRDIPFDESLSEQVRLQIEAGEQLGQAARRRGALDFAADRVLAVEKDGFIVDLEAERKNRASEAVAHMMIATNSATAEFLHERGFPVLERVVKPPERWDRVREVALRAAAEIPPGREMPSELAILPEEPDPKALGRFLSEVRARDPEHSGEVALSMLKLMGGGDYVVTAPGQPLKGHFGQGVLGGEEGYVHSTAPNRRLSDVVIQRLVKAALRGEECPYTLEQLQELADRCNQMESAAKGAERQVQKAAVSHYLQTQVGQEYVALVTGNTRKGVFVKVLDPPIEGKLVEGVEGSDVGDRLRVELRGVDLSKGYIDFARLEELPREASPHAPMLLS